MTDVIADGVYIGLPEEDYHADPALGSSGMKQLLADPADYWWSSPLNPAQEPEKDTDAKRFGRALHKCVLEGVDQFKALYAPTEHPGSTKAGKGERSAINEQGKQPLRREDYNRILASSAFIRANEHLASAFTNGVAEISVFWKLEDDFGPIRLKARFDNLKLHAITDLKSIRNPLRKPFARACRDAIANYEYLISASHYMEGRRQMARLLADGAFEGGTGPQRAFVEDAAQIDQFAFVLVFYQAEGAPISLGYKISPSNPLLETAGSAAGRAIYTYGEMRQQFGENAAWMAPRALEELDETDMPVWWTIKQNQGD